MVSTFVNLNSTVLPLACVWVAMVPLWVKQTQEVNMHVLLLHALHVGTARKGLEVYSSRILGKFRTQWSAL